MAAHDAAAAAGMAAAAASARPVVLRHAGAVLAMTSFSCPSDVLGTSRCVEPRTWEKVLAVAQVGVIPLLGLYGVYDLFSDWGRWWLLSVAFCSIPSVGCEIALSGLLAVGLLRAGVRIARRFAEGHGDPSCGSAVRSSAA